MRRVTLALGTALTTCGTMFAAGAAMAQALQNGAPLPPSAKPAANAPGKQAEEIIVTATRRSESTLKVPYNITALSGAKLRQQGITDLTGLRNSVAGLTIPDYGERASNVNNNFIIRGINTNEISVGTSEFPNLGGATVSNYIDETPLFVNLRLTDVQRVEILRGPQGTLFGADSEGGTIRTIHNKPDPTHFDYQLDGTLAGTDRASQPNSASNLTLNIPVTPRFAIRLNAGYDRGAGFIDADRAVVYRPGGNPVPMNAQPMLANPADPLNSPYVTTTNHGINSNMTWFVRADALWNVTDDLSAEFSYQHQDDRAQGFSFEAPGADYVTHRRIPIDPSVTKTDIGAMTLTEDLGFGTVTSSTSYFNVDTADLYDNTGIDTLYPYYYGSYPRLTTTNYDFNKDSAFSQEVRFVSPKGTLFDYVGGVFFQNRRTRADSVETVPGFAAWANLPGSGPGGVGTWADHLVDYYGGTRPGTLSLSDLVYDFKRDVQFTDLAAFGEATVHITPRWRVVGGVRVFTEDFRQTTVQHLYNAGTTFGADTLGTSAGTGAKRSQSQIFKANTSYDLGAHTLAYATFSQGYRAGGANAYPVGTCNFCNAPNLLSFGPDKANNYELGVKGVFHRLRYSTALYWIDWSRIQLEVSSTAGTPILVNGNGARSRGVEAELHYPFTETLTGGLGYAYTNAVLTQDFSIPGGYAGSNGALLPGVSRHQVNASLDYSPVLIGERVVDFHVDGSFRSGFANQIESALPNYRHLSGYALFNAFVQTQVTPKIDMQLFAHNLFNAKGVSAESSLQPGGPGPETYAAEQRFDPAEFVTRPLTVGLRVVIRH